MKLKLIQIYSHIFNQRKWRKIEQKTKIVTKIKIKTENV